MASKSFAEKNEHAQAQDALAFISAWMKAWELHLNHKKSQQFSARTSLPPGMEAGANGSFVGTGQNESITRSTDVRESRPGGRRNRYNCRSYNSVKHRQPHVAEDSICEPVPHEPINYNSPHRTSNRGRRRGMQSRSQPCNAPINRELNDSSSSVLPQNATGGHTNRLDEDNLVEKTQPDTSLSNLCLRENLIEKLRCGQYTCLICLSSIVSRDEIWSCDACFHIYHLRCMSNWALSSKLDKKNENPYRNAPRNTWRCPSCQKAHSAASKPLVYRCFCGKTSRPEYHPGMTTIPHGCDELCRKPKKPSRIDEDPSTPNCPHLCSELCHPGPCPPCVSTVMLSCPCGRVSRRLRCGERPPSPCKAPCQRFYSVGSDDSKCSIGGHPCPISCHYGDCPPCPKLIKAVCYCGRVDELTTCGGLKARRYHLEGIVAVEGNVDGCDLEYLSVDDSAVVQTAGSTETVVTAIFVGTVFSCESACDRILDCKVHKCSRLCHSGVCLPCQMLPGNCSTCPCGRVPLSKLVMNGDPHGGRTKCTDAVPVCPNICNRPNPVCGHPCPVKCHAGDCPPCLLTTTTTCRCGRSTHELTCSELAEQMAAGIPQSLCERVCKKKKTCGRHKCKNKCCGVVIHACMEVCGRTLSCGKHTCEDICHCGPCQSCWRGVIYDDVPCTCGHTVLVPPQPCGTLPPECDQVCTREHPCEHPVRHTCHSGATCPPCTVLLTKPCPGGHRDMFNVPCFQSVMTCGLPCAKPLPGCSHRCLRQCHPGDCLTTAAPHCTQLCARPRSECGHPCARPCHEADGISCADVIAKASPKCRQSIQLTCICGLRQEEQACFQVKLLARRLFEKDPSMFLRGTHAVKVSTDGEKSALTQISLPFGLTSSAVLPCDPACSRAKKAQKLASAEAGNESKMWVRGGAHVQDDSLPPPFPPPEYSDWLKQYASSNFVFASDVEQKLLALVERARGPIDSNGTSEKCPSHRFAPMNKFKRRFVRELAEFYGVETIAFDHEPHRHLLAMTTRIKAVFPGGTRQHYVSLSGQLQKQLTGPVRVADPPISSAKSTGPLKPALLRAIPGSDENNSKWTTLPFAMAAASNMEADPAPDD